LIRRPLPPRGPSSSGPASRRRHRSGEDTGKLLALISIGIVLVLVVAGGGYVALSRGGNQAQSNNPQLSEAGYRAACREIAASELTDHADADRGSYVKVAGTVVVYETDLGAAATTRLIISVTDPTNRLGSGKLPVLVSYQGKTSAFINDTVTVYGQVYGNFDYQSAQIAKKTLPGWTPPTSTSRRSAAAPHDPPGRLCDPSALWLPQNLKLAVDSRPQSR